MLLRRDIPFIRISISFALGIIFYEYFTWDNKWVLACSLIFTLLYLFSSLKKSKIILPPIIFMFFFVVSGYQMAFHSDQRNDKYYFANYLENDIIKASAFIDEAKLSNSRWRLTLRLGTCYDEANLAFPCSGKVMASIEASAIDFVPEYGNKVYLASRIQLIEKPKNPHAFNYKKFMNGKGIFHQTYLRDNQLFLIEKTTGKWILAFAQHMRDNCLESIEKYIKGGDEKAVIAALSLGYKDWLVDEIRNQYADTGAMHVLAVSGLHTGIIAAVMFLLTGFIKSKKTLPKIFRLILCLSGVWIFALIAGMAPSVMRAATMFSFLLIGKTFIPHSINSFNIVALSAFLLMLADPKIIYQVGFQLSYSAVLGILIFQDKFYRLIYPGSINIVDKTWQLITVSTAAQLGTLPFSIWYFHIFPSYFWLSGLFVVPLAGVILILSVLLFGIAPFSPFLAVICAYLLEFFTWLMNKLILATNYLPFLKSEGLWINWVEFILIIVAITLFALFLHTAKGRFAQYCLYSVLLLMISFIYNNEQKLQQQILTAYPLRNGVLIDYFEGKYCYCLSSLDSESPEIKKLASNNRSYHGINHCQHIPIDSVWIGKKAFFNNNSLSIENKIILKLDGENIHVEFPGFISKNNPTPALLISNNENNSKVLNDGTIQLWQNNKNGALNNQEAFYLNLKNIKGVHLYEQINTPNHEQKY